MLIGISYKRASDKRWDYCRLKYLQHTEARHFWTIINHYINTSKFGLFDFGEQQEASLSYYSIYWCLYLDCYKLMLSQFCAFVTTAVDVPRNIQSIITNPRPLGGVGQSRGGGLLGLSPANKAPSSLNLNFETLKIGVFIKFQNAKPPRTNVKTPYWKLSGDGSGLYLLTPSEFKLLKYMLDT